MARIDTAQLGKVDTCVVGYQPEDIVVSGNKLYVANSGGYRAPVYDSTVSVIDLSTFKEIYKINVAINIQKMRLDRSGNLWVSTPGNYYDIPSRTFVIDTKTDKVTDTLEVPNANMALRIADQGYVLETGRISLSGTGRELLADESVKAAYLGKKKK